MVSQVNLKCDFGKGVSEDIYARYGESGRVVNFDFVNSNIEGGVVEVSNARFCLVKSDGNFVIQDFDNSAGLGLTSNMCASSGVGSYEVQTNIDGVVVSGRGSFIVSDRVWNDEVVESVSEGNGLVFPDDFQEKLEAGEGIKIEGNVISWDGTVDWTRWYKEMKEWREASLIFGEAKFETVEEGLLKELVVGVEPVQDLHGYEYPWIGGEGNNLLIPDVKTISSYGITYTINNDGEMNINGTTTTLNYPSIYGKNSSDISILYPLLPGLQGGDSIFFKTFGDTLPNGCDIGCKFNKSDGTALPNVFPVDDILTIPSNAEYMFVFLRIQANVTLDNITIRPMISKGTNKLPYEPYSNICPISGWNSVDVSLKDGDGVSQREYGIALGQTVYGGVLDVSEGILSIKKVNSTVISMSAIDQTRYFAIISPLPKASKTNVICDKTRTARNLNEVGVSTNNSSALRLNTPIPYSNVTELMNAYGGSFNIVYDLDAEIEVPLTPKEILALEGVNNISANSGGVVSCVYSKIANYISARSVFMDNGETVQKAVSDLQ